MARSVPLFGHLATPSQQFCDFFMAALLRKCQRVGPVIGLNPDVRTGSDEKTDRVDVATARREH